MRNITPFLIIILLISIIFSSACIENTKANNTWGEKKISIESISISNDTNGNHSEQNDSVYYVNGYLINKNPYEALNVKINVITYYSNGTIFAINNTPYLNPKNIPANGKSYLYARFEDPDNKIVRFDIKIIDAKGEY